MQIKGTFPFGQPLRIVEQKDRSPKKIFILGVYASAVHAKWIDPEGRIKIKALAVASEPYIFWRGDEVRDLIEKIQIPEELGYLEPADSRFNGPSGMALDEHFLKPIGLNREDAWICDMVPHSCINKSQLRAIDKNYIDFVKKFNLPEPSIPLVPSSFTDSFRRQEILTEIEKSKVDILITLGDQPLRWFISFFNPKYIRLSYFSKTSKLYGNLHKIKLGNLKVKLLPLVHPRQAGKLGRYSIDWQDVHTHWIIKKAKYLFKAI